jgi:ubiquinone/menaquinone biosynthesis C-methylase UbiE
MIEAEDADGHLARLVARLAAPADRRLLDLGTGTGRLPLWLAGSARLVVALDLHRAMLLEQRRQQPAVGSRWPLVQSDMRYLPFPSRSFEVVTAGWAIGHLRSWFAPDWRGQIGRVLADMQRVAVPGARLIVLETLSTGSLAPAAPTPSLAEYYAWLEGEWGYQREVVRTDYVFDSAEAAVAHTQFFFGPDLAAAITRHGWARVPEWTGVWHRTHTG